MLWVAFPRSLPACPGHLDPVPYGNRACTSIALKKKSSRENHSQPHTQPQLEILECTCFFWDWFDGLPHRV